MPLQNPPRYYEGRPLPPYSYVTGLAPHPTRDPCGHSFHCHEPPPAALDEATYRGNPAYLYGLDLFNHGYYWEAHEVWEGLWHACGRGGRLGDFLKGLIKLAAAAVKVREGRPRGVVGHARSAGALFRQTAQALLGQGRFLGLDLAELARFAEVAETCAGLAAEEETAGRIVYPFVLCPAPEAAS
jgi:uncharacterized protein